MRWQATPSSRIETLGGTPASSKGTTVTSGAGADTKGSWVDIGGATAFDYDLLLVKAVAGNASNFGIDIGINVGGTRFVIAADICLAALVRTAAGALALPLPLHIPRGSQLSVRCAAASASQVVYVVLTGCSIGLRGAGGYSRCIALYTPVSSRGVDLDPTTANTDTAWTTLIASSASPVEAIFAMIGGGGETSRTINRFYLLDLAIGSSGNEWALLSDIPLGQDASGDTPRPSLVGPMPFSIPSGTRFAARVRTDDVTAGERKIDVALFGLVP